MRSGQSLYAGSSPHFYCYACGGREAVDMPIRLEDVVRRADAFRRAHRECAPPGRTATSGGLAESGGARRQPSAAARGVVGDSRARLTGFRRQHMIQK